MFKYVNTEENPADDPTRGVFDHELELIKEEEIMEALSEQKWQHYPANF